jgi:hypothetical protein
VHLIDLCGRTDCSGAEAGGARVAELSVSGYKSVRLAIYLRDGFTCVYCQRDLHAASDLRPPTAVQ